ncbi:SDR family oxidoreductase [Stenotrophomonas tuberculopleuritidis]|uniref:SDR family oxidoreductase n=1 Tax=Stenotrophomonas tuberculopleuritidis TaxID=3055079 RepID=UPI0026E55B9E|nr:SDR family oxidoreductase [Stenotrophomonas sp. 704A1]
MQRVLIIGATSAIAEATARAYALRGSNLFLVGRNAARLDAICADLVVRGAAHCHAHVMDVVDIHAHAATVDAARIAMGGIDIALIAHGTLPDQTACDSSVELAIREFTINGTATISLASTIAAALAKRGTLAVISSVAGDRGRASNYLYGSAKAAVSTYLSGLGQRLQKPDINVLVIKPGFVDTPMTAAFKKGPLWATPEKIARGIVAAIDKRKAVAYLPWFWWGIMMVIKNIPEGIFRRMKL